LTAREILIEHRISKQIEHMGIEERILFEQKDMTKELEDMKNINDAFE